jgi:hypothetical protein
MEILNDGETRALARLPNLDIEILHRPARDGRGEQVALLLSAHPQGSPALMNGFSAPMLLWMQMLQAMWSPWFVPASLPQPTSRPYRARP